MRDMNHTRQLHNNKLVLSFCGGTKNLEAIDAENYSHEIQGKRKKNASGI